MSVLNFDVFWRDHGASAGMKKLGADADKSAKRMQAFSTVSVAGVLALGTAFVKFGADSVKAAQESNKVQAQTAAVLKSTGGAANVTAKQIDALATSISKKTGIDDEAIQSGENMLLTFTNIRNEVGKGNNVFTQATGVITDMSVALGQDMKSSAMQVGKALNDPIKGLTALQRVGVSFTQKQKDLIKHLVKTGDVAGAQKVILHELKKEFGGSAEAAATWADKAKVAMDNAKESFGKKLLPALEKVSRWFVTDGADSVGVFLDSFDASALDDFASSLTDIGDAMKGFNTANDSFANMIEEQRAMILKWRITMLKALIAVADAWGKISPEGRKAAAGLRKMLAETRKDAADTANKINRTKIEIKLRADKRDAQAKIRDIDSQLKKTHNAKVITKLKADKAQAQANIRSINAQLNQLDGKQANVWIRTHRVTYYGTKGKPPTNPKGDHGASGGLIGPGGFIRRAAGGGVPGYSPNSRADNIPAMLTAGEYVQPVSAVRRYGEGAMNAIRTGRARVSYASGGSVGTSGGGGTVIYASFPNYVGDKNDLVKALVDLKRTARLDVVLR